MQGQFCKTLILYFKPVPLGREEELDRAVAFICMQTFQGNKPSFSFLPLIH